MNAPGKHQPLSRLGGFIQEFEENAIAMLLGLMTVLTFLNVVRRYVFNASLIWSLEVVLIALCLDGAVRHRLWLQGHRTSGRGCGHQPDVAPGPAGHGDDLGAGLRALRAVAAEGRLGLLGALRRSAAHGGALVSHRHRLGHPRPSYFETDQIPMPGFLRFLEDWINYGEHYSKLPRVVPYVILPISALLILLRIVQATLAHLLGCAGQPDRQP